MSKADVDRSNEEKDSQDNAGSQEGGRVGSDRDLPTIYLFGRTGREKEEWFRRILLASKLKSQAAKTTASLPASKSGEWIRRFHPVSTTNNINTDVFSEPGKYIISILPIKLRAVLMACC